MPKLKVQEEIKTLTTFEVAEKRNIIRSQYALFRSILKIAERAESAGDQENLQWALSQLQSMISGKLRTKPNVVGPMPKVLETFDLEDMVTRNPIGGPPPPKRPPKETIETKPNPLSVALAEAQGRTLPNL